MASEDIDVAETWIFSVLEEPPACPRELSVRPVFYSDAKEIEAKPNLKALTHTYEKTKNWYAAGAQILSASGWRPDCTREDSVNLERALP